jgi:cell wall assembly regulator SMI1
MLIDSLNRIEGWLADHAPRILQESLNPGASDATLNALETTLGRPLPTDYRALYRWRDGLNEDADNVGSLWYGLSLLPLAEVQAAHTYLAAQKQTSPLRQASPTLKATAMQNPYWLRLGFDGAHGWLLVDLDPAPAGTYGQVLYLSETEESAFRVAGSVAELLATFAQDVAQGLYTLDEDALEDDNEFLVPAPLIDLGNAGRAGRWQHAFTS